LRARCRGIGSSSSFNDRFLDSEQLP
jgi:hypothetical protein